jgi:hypothetical protein
MKLFKVKSLSTVVETLPRNMVCQKFDTARTFFDFTG